MHRSLHIHNEAPLASNDRRRRSRVRGDARGWVLPSTHRLAKHAPGDEAWEVRIHDVSRFGVGFTSTDRMEIGEEHRLRIGLGPIRRARLVRVAACREEDDGTFMVGAEFLDVSTSGLAKAG